jgi:hypothetical protein
MPDDMFPSLSISKFMKFSEACRQTLVLYERASDAGSCVEESSGVELKSRVEAVTAACCEQDGVNTCTAGAPLTCDTECAIEFLPWYGPLSSPPSHIHMMVHSCPPAHLCCLRLNHFGCNND